VLAYLQTLPFDTCWPCSELILAWSRQIYITDDSHRYGSTDLTLNPSLRTNEMVLTTMPSSTTRNANGNGHFPQKLKAFFRTPFGGNNGERGNDSRANSGSTLNEKDAPSHFSGAASPGSSTPRTETKGNLFRQNRFFATVGRLRSTTVASEGHALDEALSPTAFANPYFAHQGQPGLRHHNEGSVPPSPPDTPSLKIQGVPAETGVEQATASTKEELARKLRRVASAPNAQGLFAKGKEGSDDRPATAELGKEPLVENQGFSSLGLVESKTGTESGGSLAVPDADSLGALPPPGRTGLAFRRTYSSNSIKVRDVEVGPQSFDKIKLIGKGDVGKVYLVREKKSSRLYAMKGKTPFCSSPSLLNGHKLMLPSQC
jgi:protein-serine/threonine kinase